MSYSVLLICEIFSETELFMLTEYIVRLFNAALYIE